MTGSSEQGTFLTGEAPTADTPADGSTNAGINATRANRVTETDRAAQTDEAAQTDQAAPTD
ncbi:hypothetical protein L083_6141 [Actinoplanes sp. N902-109]|nr:hypothetical protein L083_6141 [Actinoplanes sp. N902-109]